MPWRGQRILGLPLWAWLAAPLVVFRPLLMLGLAVCYFLLAGSSLCSAPSGSSPAARSCNAVPAFGHGPAGGQRQFPFGLPRQGGTRQGIPSVIVPFTLANTTEFQEAYTMWPCTRRLPSSTG